MRIYSDLGFPSLYIDWVRECTTTSKFSAALNGNLVGYFGGKKMKRQGDYLSFYFFVIAIEVFSKLM